MWLSGRQQSQRSWGSTPMLKRGPDRAPEEVAVGEADRVRGAGAAGGEDAAADRVHVVLPQQRQVGLGLGQLTGVVELDRRFGRLDHGGALLGAHRGAEREEDGADLEQRVDEDGLLAARVHGEGDGRAAADTVGGEAAGDPGRLGLELGERHLLAVGDERGAVGATLGSLGKPVVELHMGRDIVAMMPNRHKDAPPEEELYAPIEWRAAAEGTRTSATRRARGSPRSRSTGPRSATRSGPRR